VKGDELHRHEVWPACHDLVNLQGMWWRKGPVRVQALDSCIELLGGGRWGADAAGKRAGKEGGCVWWLCRGMSSQIVER
jgi:hypothetical protein